MPARAYDGRQRLHRRALNLIDPLPAAYRRLARAIDRRDTIAAGKVLANSQFIAEAVRTIYGVDARVSYHGVDTDQFRPLHLSKQNMVLSVGSLTPLKGFDFLIRVIACYAGIERPLLVIASNFQNAPERAYLEQLASELGVQVRLLSNVNDDKLAVLYNEAKVVAYTPVREPFGLVPLEAMACATPVVGVDEGGVRESVVHDRTGMLVPRDPFRFAAALQVLLENPALARRYGEAGREYVVQNWSWHSAALRVESFLTEMSNSRSDNRREVLQMRTVAHSGRGEAL
jgi:glycosyltransferase involved in cell wall biosynthesis